MDIEVKYNLFMTQDGYWRLQAWVSRCGDSDDPNVFVFQRLPDLPNKDDSNEIFVDIAGRSDMEEYPVDAPSDGLSFFRRRYMDVSISDSSEMQSAVRLIERDIRKLSESYEAIPS